MAADTERAFLNTRRDVGDKRRTVREVADRLGSRADRAGKVVHCHGVFDLLHIGHIRHLEMAKQRGSHLVVTITPDRFVNKGPHRPAFPEALRAEALASLECVDSVCISEWPTAVEAIRAIEPDVFLKGVVAGYGPRDRNGAIDTERAAIEAIGGELVLTDTELHSASALINRHTNILSPELRAFLEAFRSDPSSADLGSTIERLKSLRVLVVGDSYAVAGHADEHGIRDRYAGGALAVANALAQLCDDVGLATAPIAESASANFLSKNVTQGINAKILSADAFAATEIDASIDGWLDRYDVVLHFDRGSGVVSTATEAKIRDRALFYGVDRWLPAGANASSELDTSRVNHTVDLLIQSEVRPWDRSGTARRGDGPKARPQAWRRIAARGEKLASRIALSIREDSSVVVADQTTGLCVVVPPLPVSNVNRADFLGTREALFALAGASAAVGIGVSAIGFIAGVARTAAVTQVGSGRPLEPTSLLRQIDSLLA